eukprot:4059372-Amphidinium_carterae.2
MGRLTWQHKPLRLYPCNQVTTVSGSIKEPGCGQNPRLHGRTVKNCHCYSKAQPVRCSAFKHVNCTRKLKSQVLNSREATVLARATKATVQGRQVCMVLLAKETYPRQHWRRRVSAYFDIAWVVEIE